MARVVSVSALQYRTQVHNRNVSPATIQATSPLISASAPHTAATTATATPTSVEMSALRSMCDLTTIS
jgi:hypothetical protein